MLSPEQMQLLAEENDHFTSMNEELMLLVLVEI